MAFSESSAALHRSIEPILEAQRQRYIDMLYDLDGRQDPAHPQHARYTGLLAQRAASLLSADFDLLLNGFPE